MESPQTGSGVDWKDLTNFTPKQKTAAEAMYTHRYILYGGARGGGKSRLVRWALVEFLIYLYQELHIEHAHVMLACETYADLRDRQISKIKIEMPSWMGEIKATQEEGLGFFLPESLGSGVIALRNLDDPTKYQSAEFAAIAVDELTKIQKSTFDILRGSLRWPGVAHTIFLGSTNPGGAGHAWVKQLWIDRSFPDEMKSKANEFVFIQALPKDNPYLDESYWEELRSLPPKLRAAWMDGDWSVFSGMAFPAWSAQNIIEPFEIPPHWPKTRAVDWGYAEPFCCLWTAKDPDTGRVFVYREAYATELTDAQQAKLIGVLTPKYEQIAFTYADPSMWSRKTAGNLVSSSFDEYLKHGIYLSRADNQRLSGKRKIDRLLLAMPDGQPGLQVFNTCANLIRTMPLLSYSPTNPEDIDQKQEDHAYDTLRYALTNEREMKLQAKRSENPWVKVKTI